LLGPEGLQETTKKVKMIQEKMIASQSRKKSYHDKRRKDIEFQVGDHVFLRVNPVTSVVLEQGCFTSHLLSFDNNKVLKIINWIC